MTPTERLIASDWQGVIYSAGCSDLLANIGSTPGASNLLLEATLPYSQDSMSQLLGYKPESFCSERISRQLAMSAYLRARNLSKHARLFGLGITASLRTTRPKRGEHRAYIGVQTATTTQVSEVTFVKDQLTRQEEERQLTNQAIAALLQCLGLDSEVVADMQPTKASLDIEVNRLLEDSPCLIGEPGNALLPGAFNPLHRGHRRIRDIAQSQLGVPVRFELSIRNVDKPLLDYIDVVERRRQFEEGDLVLTNLPTFFDKARTLFPDGGGTFVVGADTLERIGQQSYYDSSVDLDRALSLFNQLEIQFLVFGRSDGTRFISLENSEIPDALRERCSGIAEFEFRDDISSTEIRAKRSS